MTDEERRLLRLENAYATLAELAANQDERAFSLKQLIAKQDERTAGLEESFKMLVELARNASERADQHETWINELGAAQANSEAKIAALTDAQIRTSEALVRLAESQAHTDRKLEALIEIVRKSHNGNSEA